MESMRGGFLDRNKTKLLGLLVVTVGYLQLPANVEVISGFFGESALPTVNMVLGLFALWFGFLNSPEPPSKSLKHPEDQG